MSRSSARPLALLAGAALGLLAVVALVLAGLVAGIVQGRAGGSGLAVFAAGVALALGWSAVVGIRASHPDRAGMRVDAEEQPALWALARELADRVRGRAPEEIWLVSTADVVLYDRLTPWGQVRALHIGVPLLMGLSSEQARWCVAREFFHSARAGSRAESLVHRAARRFAVLVDGLNEHPIAQNLARSWSERYFAAARPVLDERELAADAAAAHIVGVPVALAAAREARTLATAWDHFLEHYLFWALEAGYRPAHALGGFQEFLSDAGRGAELERVRRGPQDDPEPFDTRPPLNRRIIALGDLAATELVPPSPVTEDRSAFALLFRPAVALDGVFLAMLNDKGRDLPVVEWAELFASAGPGHLLTRARAVQAAADKVLTAKTTPEDVLDLVAAGRAADLLREGGAVDPEASDLDEVVEALLGAYLAVLGMDAGALRWSLSWDRDAMLVRAGEAVPSGDESQVEADLLAAVRAAMARDAKPAKDLLASFGVSPSARVAPASHRV